MVKFIEKITSRYVLWSILCLYCIMKLIPYTNNKRHTYYFFGVSAAVLIIRFIRDFAKGTLFKKDKVTLTTYVIAFFAVLSYIVDSKLNINSLLFGREYISLATIVINLLAIFYVDKNDSNNNKRLYLNYLFYIILFFSIIYTLISLVYSIFYKMDRVSGLPGENVVFYSQFIILAIGAAVYTCYISKNKFIKYISIFSIVVHIIALFFTQQRNAYLGFLVSIITIFFILKTTNKLICFKDYIASNRKIVGILISIFIIILLAAMVSIKPHIILNKIFNINSSGRFNMWKYEIMCLLENNTILGFAGSALDKINEFYISHPDVKIDPADLDFIRIGQPHSIYMAFLCDFGIIGLIGIIVFLYLILKKYILFIKMAKNNDKLFIYALVGSFVIMPHFFMGFFDENMIVNFHNFPGAMFLICSSFLVDGNY